MKSDTISVIIPAYNEEETILKNLKKLEDVLESFSKQHALNYEVIIVDDGSDDNTYAEVTKYKKLNRKIKLISYIKNGGKGNALKAGFAHVSGNYIAFLDADLDISPDHIPTFYRYMMEKDADVVIGSKHHPESNLSLIHI